MFKEEIKTVASREVHFEIGLKKKENEKERIKKKVI